MTRHRGTGTRSGPMLTLPILPVAMLHPPATGVRASGGSSTWWCDDVQAPARARARPARKRVCVTRRSITSRTRCTSGEAGEDLGGGPLARLDGAVHVAAPLGGGFRAGPVDRPDRLA